MNQQTYKELLVIVILIIIIIIIISMREIQSLKKNKKKSNYQNISLPLKNCCRISICFFGVKSYLNLVKELRIYAMIRLNKVE